MSALNKRHLPALSFIVTPTASAATLILLAISALHSAHAIPVCLAPVDSPEPESTHSSTSAAATSTTTSATQTPPLLNLPDPRDQSIGQHFVVTIAGTSLDEHPSDTQCTEVNSNKIAVNIRSNNNPKTSFVLNRSEYSQGVCIFYRNLYDSWSAWELDSARHICPR